MRLRSLTQHLRDQNWFAVWLDFVIVVVGVFIGIQVANWNEAQAEHRKETAALIELKNELQASIITTQVKLDAYEQATEAGERSLAFIAGNQDCAERCWIRLVDFMHASQWQSLQVNDSSYRNMRSEGFPSSLSLTNAVEAYLAQVNANLYVFTELPVYRSLVRQLVTSDAAQFYWDNCYSLVDGFEEYVLDCPEGVPPEQASAIVSEIVHDPGMKRHLTEWVGDMISLPQTLSDQNAAAQRAIDLIAAEIERR